MKAKNSFLQQFTKANMFTITVLLVIATAIIGIVSGFGYGKYLLLSLLLVSSVIFAFKSYANFLILLVFISSNIGLISQNFSIQMANGNNLVELRDLIILLGIVVGVVKGRKNIAGALRHPLVWAGCLICLIAFIGMIVGFFNNGDTITIVKEFYTLECWVIPLVVVANINTRKEIDRIFIWLIIIGFMVVIGADIEALTNNAVHLVSSYSVGSVGTNFSSQSLSRSIPEANSMIAFTALVLFVYIVTSSGNPLNKNIRNLMVLLLIFILLSSFYIQLRTSVAVFCLGMLIYVFFLKKIERVNIKKILLLALLVVMIVISVVALYKILSNSVSSNVAEVSLQRFKNLIVNIEKDGRIIEYPFVFNIFIHHPLFGIGFGSDFRSTDLILKYGEPSATIHNCFSWFLIKMGILGVIPFTIFAIASVKSFIRNLRLQKKTQNLCGIALSLGLIGLLIQSLVGNVFALIQSVPIAMVIVGLVAANENEVERSLTLLSKPRPNEPGRPVK